MRFNMARACSTLAICNTVMPWGGFLSAAVLLLRAVVFRVLQGLVGGKQRQFSWFHSFLL